MASSPRSQAASPSPSSRRGDIAPTIGFSRSVIQFALLGLGIGAAFALASQGLILIKRGSGVLNFSQGALAAVGAYTYYRLHANGVPAVAAFALALLLPAFIGVAMHVFLMRPLRNASPLSRLIATLGVMSLIQQVMDLWFGATTQIVSSILPSGTVTIGSSSISEDRLLNAAVALAITAALYLVYRYSRFGLTTLAVAENELVAEVSGHSANVVAAVNWGLGGALAGLAGVLIAPISGLDVDNLVLLIVPALAAGLVGSFESFPITLVAALVMGIAESEMVKYIATPGWGQSVPFIAVIIVMAVRGKALPVKDYITDRLPSLGTGAIRLRYAVPVIVGAGVLMWTTPLSWTGAFTTTFIGGILCLSLVILTGIAGQLSLAQLGFAGVAAYAASRGPIGAHWPFLAALAVGVVAAVAAGLVVAVPALRTRGVNLAIATFGAGFAIENVLFDNYNYTGYPEVNPSLFGWSINPDDFPKRYALVCLVLLVVVALIVANVRAGRAGRRLTAMRGNERAAAALGVSVYGAKLYAFGLSAAIAGLGGVLLAFSSTYVSFTQFDVFSSITLLLLVVIGSVGFVSGGLIGGLNVAGGLTTFIVSEIISSGSVIQDVTIAFDVMLLLTLVLYPNGVASLNIELLHARQEKRSASRPRSTETPLGAPVSDPNVEHRVTPMELVVRDIHVSFGGIHALNGVSISVSPGEVVGVMGPNGAGKTTLIDVITGFLKPDSGSIEIDGKRIEGLSASRRSRRGMGRSFQSLELFDELSVRENIAAASDRRDFGAYFSGLVVREKVELTETARAAVAMLQLQGEMDRTPRELAYGQRRLVAIARAIATEPSILLLDEPAAGLNESETEELGHLIRRLADEWGLGIVLVEHDVALMMTVCDRLIAVDFGQTIAEGTPAQIRSDPRVIASYLGEPDPEPESVPHADVGSAAQ